MTFLIYYFVITLLFGIFLYVAGEAQPECITSGGEHFGSNPSTKFNDAYHLSWTTFTTVGYGNGYTSTANDLVAQDGTTKASECSAVVFLCNAEAFIGLLYAGMCGAILFGKVNRVQSHAKLVFANAVCLQYEEIEDDDDRMETDRSIRNKLKWKNGQVNDATMVRDDAPKGVSESQDPLESRVEETMDEETASEMVQTEEIPTRAVSVHSVFYTLILSLYI